MEWKWECGGWSLTIAVLSHVGPGTDSGSGAPSSPLMPRGMIYCLVSSVAIGPFPTVTHDLQRLCPKEEVPVRSKKITMLVINCLLTEGNGYENGRRKETIRRREKMDVL